MEKYNKFIHPEKPMTECLMCFGLECDSGWYPLLDSLFEKIGKTNPKPDFEIIQVKEKYGSLRVYTNYSTDEIEKLIDDAENLSCITCENCGVEGQLYVRGGWFKTLCDKCAKEKEFALVIKK